MLDCPSGRVETDEDYTCKYACKVRCDILSDSGDLFNVCKSACDSNKACVCEGVTESNIYTKMYFDKKNNRCVESCKGKTFVSFFPVFFLYWQNDTFCSFTKQNT